MNAALADAWEIVEKFQGGGEEALDVSLEEYNDALDVINNTTEE